MANIGYQWLFGILKQHQHLLVERFFDFPGSPCSLDSERPLGEFPVIAVSIPFELDFLNFLGMLYRANIPLLSDKRLDCPIIIGGGDALTLNPFPMADFFDIIVLGDGEAWARDFPKILRDMPAGMADKSMLLSAAAKIPGTWIPKLDEGGQIKRAARQTNEPAFSPILTSYGHFRNMFLVEIQIGCPFDCGFCTSGWLGGQFYNFSVEDILDSYEKHAQDAKRVGLVGSAIAEHPHIEEILRRFAEKGVDISLSSIRIDRISPEVLDLMVEMGTKSVTFAPETAAIKLAVKTGKWIPPEEIIQQAKNLAALGLREMKLYWILGLPGESIEDIETMATAIRDIAASTNLRVTCSVNPFVPKPHSRFSREPMLPHSELKSRFERLAAYIGKLDNLRLELNYSRRSRLSALLSVVDSTIIPALAEIATGGGIRSKLRRFGIELDDEIRAPEHPPTERIA